MSTFLRWCDLCQTNFTRTNWQLHGHNPAQVNCTYRDCRRKAVGHSGTEYTPTPLCSEHLIEARRSGSAVTFVDGRVCRVCDGHGRINAQERRDDSPGGQWLRCPECFGTGYDSLLRLPSSPQNRGTREQSGRRQSRRPETPSERRIREAQERAARSQWFDREVAPLADQFPGRETTGARPQGAGRPSTVPPLAPGSSAEDIRQFERSKQAARRRRTSRWQGRISFLALAGSITLTGAAVGILFVLPILPESAADIMIDIQQKVSAMFGK